MPATQRTRRTPANTEATRLHHHRRNRRDVEYSAIGPRIALSKDAFLFCVVDSLPVYSSSRVLRCFCSFCFVFCSRSCQHQTFLENLMACTWQVRNRTWKHPTLNRPLTLELHCDMCRYVATTHPDGPATDDEADYRVCTCTPS